MLTGQPECAIYRCVFCGVTFRAADACSAHEKACPSRGTREAEWASLRERFERREKMRRPVGRRP